MRLAALQLAHAQLPRPGVSVSIAVRTKFFRQILQQYLPERPPPRLEPHPRLRREVGRDLPLGRLFLDQPPRLEAIHYWRGRNLGGVLLL
jgi:hypothetical protein